VLTRPRSLAWVFALWTAFAPTIRAQDLTPELGAVQVGADRLFTEYSHLIRGKKLALVCNHTSRLSNGTHVADALFNYKEAELIVLFGMEFNVRTNDYSHPKDTPKDLDRETGLVKYSLYGEVHKPSPDMFERVDTFVFDIQDVGARFYEHVNILGFVMEAAAEKNKEVIILDRPNPITGQRQDGFVADRAFLYRFGSYAAIPALHGLTTGELGRLYNGEQSLRGGLKAKLHVVPMKGWRRSMWYDETGLQWRKPSPNLITLQSLLAYAGTCLFEALNVSEGRGSDKPFEYVGAPWLDNLEAAKLLNALELEGVRFEPVEFVPEKKPFLSRPPEYSGERCKGIFINVTDRSRFAPYRAGIALVWAVNKLHPDKVAWNFEVLERLVATTRLQDMLKQGSRPDEIFASWQGELQTFRRTSRKYLIYR
jgi:uncharacterized protein YbbC (DUF1343 family)